MENSSTSTPLEGVRISVPLAAAAAVVLAGAAISIGVTLGDVRSLDARLVVVEAREAEVQRRLEPVATLERRVVVLEDGLRVNADRFERLSAQIATQIGDLRSLLIVVCIRTTRPGEPSQCR